MPDIGDYSDLYIIVTEPFGYEAPSAALERLQQQVSSKIRSGWMPVGGICYSKGQYPVHGKFANEVANENIFYQAMIYEGE